MANNNFALIGNLYKIIRNPKFTELIKLLEPLRDQEKISLIHLLKSPNFRLDENFIRFVQDEYELPCPSTIKNSVLKRNGSEGATWIETGTYLGETTLYLAKDAKRVITIEPSKELFESAKERFKNYENIQIFNGLSEDLLDGILSAVDGGNICFWLDGHFSFGNTFKGPKDTPILEELETIKKYLSKFDELTVFIDDVRSFQKDSGYPPLDHLVEWARANNLRWHIEYDIFVAKK